MTAAITVTELFRVFQTPDGDAPALQGVDLTVGTGEVLAIIGPSGSGKSTLLRILAGLERPDAGTAIVLGERPAAMGPRELTAFRRALLGIVEQHAEQSISPDSTCRDAVALQSELLGVARRRALASADHILDEIGLADVAHRRVSSLSGGQRQRVAVAAAMGHGPRVLLADEPTGELDAASAAAIHGAIRALTHEMGTTALIVSHDAAVAQIADRVVTISEGRFATEQSGSGVQTLVVGPGGWLQLPSRLGAHAREGSRLAAEPSGDDVLLRTISTPPAPPSDQTRTAAAADSTSAGIVAELRSVSVAFGDTRVLTDISAGFEAGRLTAITGPSGSGKTTLLNVLTGRQPPTSGTCLVDGIDLSNLYSAALAELRRTRLAVVEQDVGLIPFLTARENVGFALQLRGRDPDGAEAWLLRVDLARRLDQRVERLSAGERQRVALARAFAVSPRVLLVDEPTSRLDRRNAEEVARLLAEVTAEHGLCTVCATHDDRIIQRAGRAIRLGAPT